MEFLFAGNKVRPTIYLFQKSKIAEIKLFFENEKIEKISDNIKNDIKLLNQYDIIIKGGIFDTTLAHYIINPDTNHAINQLSETYLNYSLTDLQIINW